MNSHGMYETGGEPYFYSNYTWKELRDVPAQRRVVLLPVGSTEDHGHHLPLDTDNFMAWTVCVETAKRVPDEVLVMPLIPYGYNLHHVDFPGTICVGAEHFIWLDLMDGAPLQMMDWWSSFSNTGVVGDPTLATRDKGKQMFDAVMARMVELVREFRDRPRATRQDMHAEKVEGDFGLKP